MIYFTDFKIYHNIINMRRIKSAPANLAGMSNNIKSSNKKIPIVFYSNKNNYNNRSNRSNRDLSNRNIINHKKYYETYNKNNFIEYLINKNKSRDYSNKFSEKKRLKNDISNISNLVTDITVETNHFSLEELSFIYTLVIYLNNNIFKRDKFKELYAFIIKALIRYHILLFIHIYVLHDKIDNVGKIVHAINIDQISNTIQLLPFNG